jgi:hypothetical protein
MLRQRQTGLGGKGAEPIILSPVVLQTITGDCLKNCLQFFEQLSTIFWRAVHSFFPFVKTRSQEGRQFQEHLNPCGLKIISHYVLTRIFYLDMFVSF